MFRFDSPSRADSTAGICPAMGAGGGWNRTSDSWKDNVKGDGRDDRKIGHSGLCAARRRFDSGSFPKKPF